MLQNKRLEELMEKADGVGLRCSEKTVMMARPSSTLSSAMKFSSGAPLLTPASSYETVLPTLDKSNSVKLMHDRAFNITFADSKQPR